MTRGSRQTVAAALACGPDPDEQRNSIEQYRKAGFDELYVAPIGPHYGELIDLYAKEILA